MEQADKQYSGWGILKRDYSFLQNISNKGNTRSRILDLLARINPQHSYSNLSDDSSENEDQIEFDHLESTKQNLI